MTNLDKLHLLGNIKQSLKDWHTYRDLALFFMLLGSIVCSVLVLKEYKEDEQARSNYKDCIVSLEEEVNK